MAMRYEIEEGTNAVKVFYDDSDVPSLYQPDYPDTTPWEDADEATAWAELYIASVEDPDAPYAPIGRGIPGEAKPTPEQIAEWEAQRQSMLNPPA
jgi:hypothetical protein